MMTAFENMKDMSRVMKLTREAFQKYDTEVHPEIEFSHKNEKNIPEEIFDDRIRFVNQYIADRY